MMPRLLIYECPVCFGRTREWDDEPPPRFCTHCGHDCDEPNAEKMAEQLAAPYISSAKARSVDALQRADEEGANFRAQVAMEQHGLTTEEANLIKQTNQKDNLREGDITAIEVPPMPGVGYSTPVQQALQLSAEVRQGPEPNMGLRTMLMTREAHAASVDPRHAGSTSSEIPALEVFSPLYQPRVGGTRPGVGRQVRRKLP